VSASQGKPARAIDPLASSKQSTFTIRLERLRIRQSAACSKAEPRNPSSERFARLPSFRHRKAIGQAKRAKYVDSANIDENDENDSFRDRIDADECNEVARAGRAV
jgi:hypothetical protein